jgi:hypothetical protein
MVIPLMSEFLEYTKGDISEKKEDCETKAFKRLAARLKKEFNTTATHSPIPPLPFLGFSFYDIDKPQNFSLYDNGRFLMPLLCSEMPMAILRLSISVLEVVSTQGFFFIV